jgi:hypothetical protein
MLYGHGTSPNFWSDEGNRGVRIFYGSGVGSNVLY